eukprot:6204382-Pleurochrysis_carterae.AAC.1
MSGTASYIWLYANRCTYYTLLVVVPRWPATSSHFYAYVRVPMTLQGIAYTKPSSACFDRQISTIWLYANLPTFSVVSCWRATSTYRVNTRTNYHGVKASLHLKMAMWNAARTCQSAVSTLRSQNRSSTL